MHRGTRLRKKEYLIDVVTYVGNLWLSMVFRVNMTGVVNIIMIIMIVDVVVLITFIWSCTKFLVPKTNGLLLSYKSKEAMFLYMGA